MIERFFCNRQKVCRLAELVYSELIYLSALTSVAFRQSLELLIRCNRTLGTGIAQLFFLRMMAAEWCLHRNN